MYCKSVREISDEDIIQADIADANSDEDSNDDSEVHDEPRP